MPIELTLEKSKRAPVVSAIPPALAITCCALSLFAIGLSVFIRDALGDRVGAALILLLTATLIFVVIHGVLTSRR